ncbi:amidohydrolase [Kibdelosporangium aridum]|uniref:Amidohydrolase 3 domain-containing protein n=1 Tax=Kibdelosporangium aridum TaxID=2030 RepID=A0A1W2FUN0_KIBAR|nr:amidohydrolase [Kibdelosporangium aridum]SMD25494.1 hypothetical protein SAMN05661093_09180 [Kibdelosporangium aridum]
MQVRVFHGGPVLTIDPAGTLASAVAVADGKIVAVGGEDVVEPYLKDADEVVDLNGRLLMPGFIDAHVHPVAGGLERIRCDLSEVSADQYADVIAAYIKEHPEREWVLGGGWSMEAFPGGRPTRDHLDAVVGNQPALLPNRDHHSAWASSRALELAGIDKHTPDPVDGRIERDADGVPTGLLHEGAMDLLKAIVPQHAPEDFTEALRAGQKHLHSLGIVGWLDALVDESTHEAYLKADREGWLTAKVSGALWWDRDCPPERIHEQVARLKMMQGGSRYRTPIVKVMQDGVIETFTAAMMHPYLDPCGHPTTNRGLRFLEPQQLKAVTKALDEAGFAVHFHAIGDQAIRDVLDAVEGTQGTRHQIAHVQVVHPDDVPRFHRLRVTANLQALWATHEPQLDELTLPFIGEERNRWLYPFGDLYRTGAPLAMGSDWPVSTPDPMAAIHVAVNRISALAPAGTPPLGPEQALPLAVALRAYTAGSAAASQLDRRSGTIAVGYDADLVVLDRNPFEHPHTELADTRVDRTYAEGVEVHRAD